MRVAIHRGTKQIGGCVAEIATKNTKVFIDLGANLPGNDTPLPDIDGLTCGSGKNSALFISHTHGDHIGDLTSALPEIPVYLGETAKEIELIKVHKLRDAEDYIGKELVTKEYLSRLENAKTFQMGIPVRFGDFAVTPLWVDHSAFDAYMFVIKAEGIKVLHTGDFRTHGPRGGKLPAVLSKYARKIDYIVCEGTMLSRSGEPPMPEQTLREEAQRLIHGKKYIFALCSSTNIDRIAEFYQANHSDDLNRKFVVDSYQKEILDAVEKRSRTDFYRFGYSLPYYYPQHADMLREEGFFALIRGNGGWYETELLEKYFDTTNSLLIYSEWEGYLNPGPASNEKHIALIGKYRPNTILHSSGHASRETLAEIYSIVKPKRGLIPIHGEAPEAFRTLIPEGNILVLNDGEALDLKRVERS
jgi:ribonuclease J